MANEIDTSQGEDMIGKLVAAAGRGPTAPAEVRDRVYRTVRARWEAETRTAKLDRPNRRPAPARVGGQPAGWPVRTLAMAATVGAVAIGLGLLQRGGSDAIGQTLASFDSIDGQVALVRNEGSSQLTTADSVIAGDRLRTGPDDRAGLRLDDGLVLRMNDSTEVEFVSAEEIELVAGTIYIDSGLGISSNTLEVSTPFGGVRHLGTQYEVHVDESALRLRIREGRVAVRSESLETVGDAGEQLDIVAAGLDSRGTISPDDSAWNWAVSLARLPAMAEYQVGPALEWVARERGLTLEWNAAVRTELRDEAIVGLDDLDPIEALDVLELAAGIQTRIEGNRLIIAN